jgi:hypothetical protein
VGKDNDAATDGAATTLVMEVNGPRVGIGAAVGLLVGGVGAGPLLEPLHAVIAAANATAKAAAR